MQKRDCMLYDSNNSKLGEGGGHEKSKGSVQKMREEERKTEVSRCM